MIDNAEKPPYNEICWRIRQITYILTSRATNPILFVRTTINEHRVNVDLCFVASNAPFIKLVSGQIQRAVEPPESALALLI